MDNKKAGGITAAVAAIVYVICQLTHSGSP